MTKKTMVVVLGLLILILCGVYMSCNRRTRPEYRITGVNLTGKEISDVLIRFGPELVYHAGLVKNGCGTDSKMYVPIPDEADVLIATSVAEQHRRKVSLKGVVPENFRGNIYFRFLADGTIEVKTADPKDVDANVKLMQ